MIAQRRPTRGQGSLAFLLVVAAAVLAASGPAAARADQPLEVTIQQLDEADFLDLRLVVSVTDAGGRPLTGLTAENFQVEAGGVRLPLKDARTVLDAGTGVGVVLAIDVSGSMEGDPLDRAKDVSREFILQLASADAVAALAFTEKVTTVQGFTSDQDTAIAAIQSLASGGDTALYSAVTAAADLAHQSNQPRKAILLLSDGQDTAAAGSVTRETSIDQAKASGVPFFVVGLGDAIDEPYLSELAQVTGARFFRAPSPGDLQELFDAISTLLRTQYVLTVDGSAIPADQPSLAVTAEGGGRLGRGERALPDDFFRPRVRLSSLPADEITSPVSLEAEVFAARDLTAVEYVMDGRPVHRAAEPPYSLRLDPIEFPPGEHELTVAATDVRGARGEASGTISIGAVPPRVRILNARDGTVIRGPWELELDIQSQVPLASVQALIDGEPLEAEGQARFRLDTSAFSEGAHALLVRVTDEAGGTAEAGLDLELRRLPGAGPSASLLLLLIPGLAGLALAVLLWHRWRRRRRSPTVTAGAPPPPEPAPAPADTPPATLPSPLPRATLTLAQGGDGTRVFLVEGEPVTIGSDPGCTIVLTGAGGGVARREVRLWLRENRFMLHRLARRREGQGPNQPAWAVLESGDQFAVGPYRFVFEIISEP
jgi:VWFA-related protein